jgi:hypothetical protein
MSVAFKIEAEELQDVVTAVDALGGEITGDDVRRVMGNAVRNVLRDHFAAIAQDEAHHKTARGFGVAPTGVYEEARQNTQEPELEADGVSISINQVAITRLFFGGDFEASDKLFSIPARTEARGKSPLEFDNLIFILFPSGAKAWAGTKETSRGKKKIGHAESLVYFWLAEHVHQEPDPSVLPDEDKMLDAAMTKAQRTIEEVWNEGAKVTA